MHRVPSTTATATPLGTLSLRYRPVASPIQASTYSHDNQAGSERGYLPESSVSMMLAWISPPIIWSLWKLSTPREYGVKWRSEVPALFAAMMTVRPFSDWMRGFDSASGLSTSAIEMVGMVPGGPT